MTETARSARARPSVVSALQDSALSVGTSLARGRETPKIRASGLAPSTAPRAKPLILEPRSKAPKPAPPTLPPSSLVLRPSNHISAAVPSFAHMIEKRAPSRHMPLLPFPDSNTRSKAASSSSSARDKTDKSKKTGKNKRAKDDGAKLITNADQPRSSSQPKSHLQPIAPHPPSQDDAIHPPTRTIVSTLYASTVEAVSTSLAHRSRFGNNPNAPKAATQLRRPSQQPLWSFNPAARAARRPGGHKRPLIASKRHIPRASIPSSIPPMLTSSARQSSFSSSMAAYRTLFHSPSIASIDLSLSTGLSQGSTSYNGGAGRPGGKQAPNFIPPMARSLENARAPSDLLPAPSTASTTPLMEALFPPQETKLLSKESTTAFLPMASTSKSSKALAHKVASDIHPAATELMARASREYLGLSTRLASLQTLAALELPWNESLTTALLSLAAEFTIMSLRAAAIDALASTWSKSLPPITDDALSALEASLRALTMENQADAEAQATLRVSIVTALISLDKTAVQDVDALATASSSILIDVRYKATQALASLGTHPTLRRAVVRALHRVMTSDSVDAVRFAAAIALCAAEAKDDVSMGVVTSRLTHASPAIRMTAAAAAAPIGISDPGASAILASALATDWRGFILGSAVESTCAPPDPAPWVAALRALGKDLNSPSAATHAAAVSGLTHLAAHAALVLRPLLARLADPASATAARATPWSSLAHPKSILNLMHASQRDPNTDIMDAATTKLNTLINFEAMEQSSLLANNSSSALSTISNALQSTSPTLDSVPSTMENEESLREVLENPSASAYELAAAVAALAALGCGGQNSEQLLVSVILKDGQDAFVISQALQAAATLNLESADMIQAALTSMDSEHSSVRHQALNLVESMTIFECPSQEELLSKTVTMLQDPDPRVRARAAQVLAQVPVPLKLLEAVLPACADKYPDVQAGAIRCITANLLAHGIKDSGARDISSKTSSPDMLNDDANSVSSSPSASPPQERQSTATPDDIAGAEAVRHMFARMAVVAAAHKSDLVRTEAVRALRLHAAVLEAQLLRRAITDPCEGVRLEAIWAAQAALAQGQDTKSSVKVLNKALSDSAPALRFEAAKALAASGHPDVDLVPHALVRLSNGFWETRMESINILGALASVMAQRLELSKASTGDLPHQANAIKSKMKLKMAAKTATNVAQGKRIAAGGANAVASAVVASGAAPSLDPLEMAKAARSIAEAPLEDAFNPSEESFQLNQTNTTAVLSKLSDILTARLDDSHEKVRTAALHALSPMPRSQGALPHLLAALNQPDSPVSARVRALELMALLAPSPWRDEPEAFEVLMKALCTQAGSDSAEVLRTTAAKVAADMMRGHHSSIVIESLLDILGSTDHATILGGLVGINALSRTGAEIPQLVIRRMLPHLAAPYWVLRQATASALHEVGAGEQRSVAMVYNAWLQDINWKTRVEGCKITALFKGSESAIAALLERAKDRTASVRAEAVRALSSAAVPPVSHAVRSTLSQLISDQEASVRYEALRAISILKISAPDPVLQTASSATLSDSGLSPSQSLSTFRSDLSDVSGAFDDVEEDETFGELVAGVVGALLGDDTDYVRAEAAIALRTTGLYVPPSQGTRVRDLAASAVVRMTLTDPDVRVRMEGARTLATLPLGAAAIPAVVAAAADPAYRVRVEAVKIAATSKIQKLEGDWGSFMAYCMGDSSKSVRMEALRGLRRVGGRSNAVSLNKLLERLRDWNDAVMDEVIETWISVGQATPVELHRLVSVLLDRANDGDALVRATVIRAFTKLRLRSTASNALIIKAASDFDGNVRQVAITALASLQLRTEAAVEALTRGMDDPEPDVRSAACNAIGSLRLCDSISVLGLVHASREEEDASVSQAAANALESWGLKSVPPWIEAEYRLKTRSSVNSAGAASSSDPSERSAPSMALLQAVMGSSMTDIFSTEMNAQRALPMRWRGSVAVNSARMAAEQAARASRSWGNHL